MIAFLCRVLCGLTVLPALVASSPVPHYFERLPLTRRDVSMNQVQRELGAQLSSTTTIFGPSNPSWTNTTHRWNTIAPPQIDIVVQVGKESDIHKVVKYCNQNGLEFLAVNRGHGFTTSLHRFKGVQIDLKQLTAITIQPDGKSARLQGGAYAHDVIQSLWEQGYDTTTGANECVGLMGPGLGGGHGRLEGLYGLVLDNIIHLNVVLADGSTIAVNETSHQDLFWGMRGAGHNFGIVTSFKIKIYPIKSTTWHWHNYYWTQDKLETVFEELNKIQDNGSTPALWGASYLQISFNRTISETEPLLWWTVSYNGPADEAEAILAPFNAIPALSSEQGDSSYPDIVFPQNTDASTCGSGNYAISTVLIQTYNITTQRQLYDLFSEKSALYPDLAQTARLYHEGYAVAGMQSVDPASTAYPHRDQNHLVFFLTAVPDGSNLTTVAEEWARESWDLWLAGRPGQEDATYVNYATGNDYETLESIYGREPWRLEKLHKLKAEYDPDNRFGYFVPLVSS